MKASDLSILNTPEGRLRLLSAVILAPMVLGVMCLGGASYAGLIALMAVTGLFEWLRLVDPTAPAPDRFGMYAAALLALLLAAVGYPSFGLIIIAMAGAAFYAHRSTVVDAAVEKTAGKTALWFAFGLPYMAASGIALIYLRDQPQIGFDLTAYLLAAVWGMDIGAYVTGRLFGGPKMAPSISPNKTWSGFCGGLALAGLAASLVMICGGARFFGSGFVLALVLAAVAQGGDFFKSYFKRRAGVKDCGNLIPGHGGVLDRIDGLVFAALLLAFLQALFGDLIW